MHFELKYSLIITYTRKLHNYSLTLSSRYLYRPVVSLVNSLLEQLQQDSEGMSVCPNSVHWATSNLQILHLTNLTSI